MKRRLTLLTTALLLASCVPAPPPLAPKPTIPSGIKSILILGDSQISFGAGAPYTAFFGDLAQACGISHRTTAQAIGVRSTSLHNWTARTGAARGTICDVDLTYGVNAGAYGVTSAGRTYVQIGQDPAYPFCPAGRSALEAATTTMNPDLVILSFLGNATDRWQSAATAQSDWRTAAAQLPENIPCLVMTTIPAFDAAENARRLSAQTNLERAVTQNARCGFVSGLTPQTIAAIQGKPDNFRTNSAGKVTDPRHPTETSASRFIKLQTPALCAALRSLLPQN
jgi:hypothetical protein